MKTYRIPVERIKISEDWKTAVVTIFPDDQPMIETLTATVFKLGPVDSWSVGIDKQVCVKLLPPHGAVMQCLTTRGEYLQWKVGVEGSSEIQKIHSGQFGTFYDNVPPVSIS